MPVSEYRIYADGQPLTPEQLEQVGEIRVDQAIGMATEAELTLPVSTDDAGQWGLLEEDWVQPLHRLRVELRIDAGEFVPLIDGPVVAQRFQLDAGPDDSHMVLVVHDDSVLLNRDEQVQMFFDTAESDIASQLFAQHGLTAEVDAVAAAGGALQRVIVQRGTAMQLLRELARRHGMQVYVKPGAAPGASIGVFQRLTFTPADVPELLLMGPERNVARFSAEFDALRPTRARAGAISAADRSVQSAEAETSSQSPLSGDAVHEVLTAPATTLLARTREEAADLDAATQAAVDHSAWAYSASAELSADSYGAVLAPRQVLRVAGVGGHLAGDWLLSSVTHIIDHASYRQQLGLKRNARSAGSGASALASAAGVF